MFRFLKEIYLAVNPLGNRMTALFQPLGTQFLEEPKMSIIQGVVHGKMIELSSESGFADGESVTVFVQKRLPPGEGIRRSSGAWADAGEELDRWFQTIEENRKIDRSEPNS
jgi:hypothetical protein